MGRGAGLDELMQDYFATMTMHRQFTTRRMERKFSDHGAISGPAHSSMSEPSAVVSSDSSRITRRMRRSTFE